MNRIGFLLKVKEERLEDYKLAHQAVWPEMLKALSRHGWHNYSLFLRSDGTLFGYFETEGTFAQALDGMASEEVNTRWQEDMAEFFEGTGGPADQMMEHLIEVFHLD